MYDGWSNYGPTSDDQHFADFINDVQKFVATSTPFDEWTNGEPIRAEGQNRRLPPPGAHQHELAATVYRSGVSSNTLSSILIHTAPPPVAMVTGTFDS